MEQQQQQEFARLEEQALRQLRDGRWTLRLSVLPSFHDPMILGVFDGRRPDVTWRAWRRAPVVEMLRSPVERLKLPPRLEPTIEQGTSRADPEILESALSELAAIQLPPLPGLTSIGTDGTSYEVFVSRGAFSSNFRWWETHPREWSPLMTWFAAHWKSLAIAAHATPDFTDYPFPDRVQP